LCVLNTFYTQISFLTFASQNSIKQIHSLLKLSGRELKINSSLKTKKGLDKGLFLLYILVAA